MTNTMRYALAAILLLLALGALLLPKDEKQVALKVRNVVSSVPSKERLAAESTTPPSIPHTTTPRASRSAHVTAPKAPRARSAPTPRPVLSGDVWGALAACESGGNPRAVGGGGRYFGAFQFSLGTWHSMGMPGNPVDYSFSAQLAVAQRLQARSGWGQWPHCSRVLGLR